MKIISWNVNGLRSVLRRNQLDWLTDTNVDILCLQEIKVQQEQLEDTFKKFLGYNLFLHSATRKGYSGVAVYSKMTPQTVKTEFGFPRFDLEGRGIELTFPHFTLINLYLPHGGWLKHNLEYKLSVYDFLIRYLASKRDQKIILVGDFNVAHTEIDLARPKQNSKNVMFTPEERKQIDRILSLGFVDCFRKLHPAAPMYTWWPYRAEARARKVGWRIDYSLLSASLLPSLRSASVLDSILGSDHCPIELYLF
jgi:exodeoxyribonuclease III